MFIECLTWTSQGLTAGQFFHTIAYLHKVKPSTIFLTLSANLNKFSGSLLSILVFTALAWSSASQKNILILLYSPHPVCVDTVQVANDAALEFLVVSRQQHGYSDDILT